MLRDLPDLAGEKWAALAEWAARNRWELALVLIITAAAAFLRLYRLTDFPRGLHGDEAITGLEALRILNEGWVGPYSGSALGQPSGPLFFTAVIFKLFGVSLFTLRLSMSLLGILTIPAAYLMFRVGFGRWVALIGAAAFAISYWHVHFSRIAYMVISMPLIIVLASAALLYALRSRHYWPWALAGFLLGLGVYSYNSYPMFLAGVAVFLAIYTATQPQWRPLLVRCAVLGCALLLAAMPLIQFGVNHPEAYLSHARKVSIVQDAKFKNAETFKAKAEYVAKRAAGAALLLIHHPQFDSADGAGGRGAVDNALAVLTYAGLGIAFWRWRQPAYLLAALVVMAGMATNVVTFGGELRRSLIAAPFVYGLAGVAVWEAAKASRRFLSKPDQQAALAAGAILFAGVVAWNVWYYFGDLMKKEGIRFTFATDLVDGLNAAHEFHQPGTTLYFYADRWGYNYETRRFLYPDIPGVDRSKRFGTYALTKDHPGPVTYLLFQSYAADLEQISAMYPGGETIVESDNRGKPRYVVYHVKE